MTNSKLFKTIYVSYFFVALGVFVSVSIPALFHIIALIPFIILTKKYIKEGYKLPKSAWFLIFCVVWAYVTNILNFSTLSNPMRSFGKSKYELFAVMMIPAIYYMKDYMNAWRWRKISNVFFFTIIFAAIYGISRSTLRFDLFKLAEVPVNFNTRNAGFTGIMRYGYGTGFVLSMMLACIPFFKKELPVFNKKMFFGALVLGFLGLYFAKTRGAMLGLLCSLPVIIWFFNKKIAGFIVVIGILLGIGVVYQITFNGGSSNRFLSKLGNNSNLKRLSQYEAATKAFLEKPIVGHGVNQFSSICSDVKEKYSIKYGNYCHKYPILNCNFDNAPRYCSHSHNIFLELLSNRGVFGAAFFALFLVFWAIELWKRQDIMTVAYFGLLSNYVIAGQFENIFDANNSFMFFFLYAISFAKIPERFKLNNLVKG